MTGVCEMCEGPLGFGSRLIRIVTGQALCRRCGVFLLVIGWRPRKNSKEAFEYALKRKRKKE